MKRQEKIVPKKKVPQTMFKLAKIDIEGNEKKRKKNKQRKV
jgi:hypothetical protein